MTPTIDCISVTNDTAVSRAAHAVRAGGVLLYPTDTVYGLGCDPFARGALERVTRIKSRPKKKMPLLIAHDIEMVERFAFVGDSARVLANAFWPGPLTLILPRRQGTLASFYPHENSIAFRVPAHDFCQELLKELDFPLVSTSANRAGKETPGTILSILEQFDQHVEGIALAVDGGLLAGVPSTLVSCLAETPEIIRDGALTREAVERVIHKK